MLPVHRTAPHNRVVCPQMLIILSWRLSRWEESKSGSRTGRVDASGVRPVGEAGVTKESTSCENEESRQLCANRTW